ncbi:MAG: hypothetical protein AAGC67_16395 [Myxococcota bacterium]
MKGRVALWWQGLGWLRWPSALLVLGAFGIALAYQPIAPGWRSHGVREVGTTRVELSTRGLLRRGEAFDVRIEVSSDPAPAASRAFTLRLEGPRAGPIELGSATPPFERAIELPEARTPLALVLSTTQADPPQHGRWILGRAP